MAEHNVGRVVQVIGPVLDIEFAEGKLPAIYNAVIVKDEGKDTGVPIDVIHTQLTGTVLFTLIGFCGLYLVLGLLFLFLIGREVAHGPEPAGSAPHD